MGAGGSQEGGEAVLGRRSSQTPTEEARALKGSRRQTSQVSGNWSEIGP